MNRKLFNGLLLLTVATGGVGTFTSCKDTEQDFRNEVLVGQQDLSAQIAAIRNFDDTEFKKNLQDYLDAQDYASAADLITIWSAIETAQDRLDALEAADDVLEDKVTTEIAALRDELKGYTDTQVAALQEQLDKVAADATDALEQALHNAGSIDRINEKLAVIESQVGELQGELATLQDKVTELETKYQDLFDALEEYKTNTDFRLTGIEDDLESLRTEVEDIYNRIMQKFAKLVTGIQVNQVHNAIFGTFNFPIGISSKMVANYYAMSDHNMTFPPENSVYEYYSSNPDLVGLDLAKIEAPFMQVMSANVVQLDKLADIYMTVNPANRDFEGLELSLVNSQDEPVAVLDELKLEKTDKVLTMGVSRAADNGFYVASAQPRTSYTADEIDGIKYEIEDGLLAAFKDAIKNHTKSDFKELAQLILKQFGTNIPAYAVKCEWEDTEIGEDGSEVAVKNSVRSDYELSVTTFRPLSYRSGWGFGTDAQLPTPTFGYIRDRINDAFDRLGNELKLGLDGITLDDISISLEGVNVEVGAMSIVIDLTGTEVKDTTTGKVIGTIQGEKAKITLTYTPSGVVGVPGTGELAGVAESIQNAINDMLHGEGDGSLTAQINSQLKTQLQKIVDDINVQLGNVQTKINNALGSIKDKINAELNGSFGRLAENVLDLYNSLATRINKVLKNPNAYLQIMMAYVGNDDQLHHLSTTAPDATPLSVGNNMELFLTSYNAELIVPSFKKYVAVVDATDAAGNWGDYDAAKKANEAEYLNEILEGSRQRVYIDGSKLKAGRTYKILYSSLDYRGFTSSKVYYVKAY